MGPWLCHSLGYVLLLFTNQGQTHVRRRVHYYHGDTRFSNADSIRCVECRVTYHTFTVLFILACSGGCPLSSVGAILGVVYALEQRCWHDWINPCGNLHASYTILRNYIQCDLLEDAALYLRFYRCGIYHLRNCFIIHKCQSDFQSHSEIGVNRFSKGLSLSRGNAELK